MTEFSGIELGLANIFKLSHARTRSISPENFTGEKGRGAMATEGTGKVHARDLGPGWKISPSITIDPHQTFQLADIHGAGAIQHIWFANIKGRLRNLILRVFWDGQEHPSVECPLGDFFANGLEHYMPVQSLPVCVNSTRAFNSYWPMPFASRARITLENDNDVQVIVYYQVTWAETDNMPHGGRFHAQFRRVNPLPYKQDYVILDGVVGRGHYVGTYLVWGSKSAGWFGEGEVKFFMDGDGPHPSIVYTGTEDYFSGAWGFDIGWVRDDERPDAFDKPKHGYERFLSPYSGLVQITKPDGFYDSQTRFGMYRWHIMDPIRFEQNLRVTIQALGWRPDRRYLPLQDDIASAAFWYQELPTAAFPHLPDRDARELI
jgi:hypothetical protein